MPAVIAIDPGLTGAIVALREDGSLSALADVPTRRVEKRTQLDLPMLWDRVRQMADAFGVEDGLIENVNGMGRQAGAGNFGKTIGACEMALVAAGCTLHKVTPQTWKFGVGIAADPKADTKARKNASRARAIELFPNHAHLFARVKDDGRAEAALMAWWFVHKHRRTPP